MKRQTKVLILVIALVFIVIVILSLYWINLLRVAHSTFDNYYEFRGCKQLINETDTSGFCKLASGQIIEIVKYNNKWYLNGDLPTSFPDW